MKHLVLAVALASLAALTTGCARRAPPAYVEPAPCPYDNAAPAEPASSDPPSRSGPEPVLVSPA